MTGSFKEFQIRIYIMANFVLTLNSQALEAREHPGMNAVLILIKDFLVGVTGIFWTSSTSVIIGFYSFRRAAM